jgi:hypothetical protein
MFPIEVDYLLFIRTLVLERGLITKKINPQRCSIIDILTYKKINHQNCSIDHWPPIQLLKTMLHLIIPQKENPQYVSSKQNL